MTTREKRQYFYTHSEQWAFGGWKIDEIEYLELTPLSEITNKDMEQIGFILPESTDGTCKLEFVFGYNSHWKLYFNGKFHHEGFLLPKNIDYLRFKGYALPFRNYSVEDLIKEKVLKLKS